MFVCIFGMYCYFYVFVFIYELLIGYGYWYIGIDNEIRLLNENDIKVNNNGDSKIYIRKLVSNDDEKDEVKLDIDRVLLFIVNMVNYCKLWKWCKGWLKVFILCFF